MAASRFLIWVIVGLLILANWAWGDRIPNQYQSVVTAILIVIVSVALLVSFLREKSNGRDIDGEMKQVDQVMRKEDMNN